MTDVFLSSKLCDCEPDDVNRVLVIVEGNTTVWACTHINAKMAKHERVWKNV